VSAGNLSPTNFQDYSVTLPADEVAAGDTLEILFFGLPNPSPGDYHTVLIDNVRLQANLTPPIQPPPPVSGIPAWWCAEYGLNPNDTNMPSADPAGDTLSNAEKYYCGLDPNVAYTVTDALTLSGAAGVTNLGTWTVDGNDLYAVDRRGQVDYTFNVTAGDTYRLQVLGTQNCPITTGAFDLRLSIDGQFMARCSLAAAYGTNGLVRCFTPFLRPGAHTVSIFWENAASLTSLRLKSVTLQSIAGPDTNGNGIKDWVEAELALNNTVITTNATSFTSTAFIQGNASFAGLVSISCSPDSGSTNFPGSAGPNNLWYANAPLSATGTNVVTIAFESGALVLTQQVVWTPRNLLAGGSITIRQGDSLLLTAQPIAGPGIGSLIITVGTNQVSTPASQPLPYQFTQPGVVTVTGTVNDQNGAPQTGSLSVNVVGYAFPAAPACLAGQPRGWAWPMCHPKRASIPTRGCSSSRPRWPTMAPG
jgi:hypothetical protein